MLPRVLSIAPFAMAAPAYASERMAADQDSWLAFAYLLVSILVGVGLSATLYKLRRPALWGLVIMFIAGAAAIGAAKLNGYFEQFQPPKTFLDPFKIGLLYAFMSAAALAALFIAYIASRPKESEEPPAQRHDLVSRALHWSTAIIFLTLIPLGLFMSGLPREDPLRAPVFLVHKSLGMTILLLVLARLIWHAIHPVPPLSSDLSKANRASAKAVHATLYLLMLGFPITGYFLSSYVGKIVPLYFIDLPSLVAPSKAAATPFGLLHKIILPLIFYLAFAAHVAGVVKHHFLDKQKGAIRRMLG